MSNENPEPQTYLVDAYVNVSPIHFSAYDPRDPIAHVVTLSVDVTSSMRAASAAFTVGNKMENDANGVEYPSDVRSLSVNDVLKVGNPRTGGQIFYRIDSVGFEEIIEPVHRIVALIGTNATRREAAS